MLSPCKRQIAHALLTRPPLSSPPSVRKLPKNRSARLACVRHAASVRPEPGSNSQIISLHVSMSFSNLTFWLLIPCISRCSGFSYSISLTSYMLFLIHLTVISLYAVYFSKFIPVSFVTACLLYLALPLLSIPFLQITFFCFFYQILLSALLLYTIYTGFIQLLYFCAEKIFSLQKKKFFSAFAARIERNVRLAKIC